MFIVHIVSYILLISVGFIEAQSCDTPKDGKGNCVSLYDCKLLLDLIQKKDKTPENIKFLRDSQCGYADTGPMVCCPNPNACVTPDNNPGQCVGIYNCTHITAMLRNPTQDDINYVRNSVCTGPEPQSVCCGPQRTQTQPPVPKPTQTEPSVPKPTQTNTAALPSNIRCANIITAFPPDPSTKCCGIEGSTGNKIFGGTETKIDEYPWLTVIQYVKLGVTKLLCGGALISTKYVITAGHCIAGSILNEGTPKFVRLGEYNTTNSGPDCIQVEAKGLDCADPVVIAPIEKTIPHPEYNPYHNQRRHDIGLIRLQIAAPYSDFIRPICMPSKDYILSPPPNFRFQVAGWGRYKQFENGTRLSSKVKLHVQVPYVLRDNCQVAQRTLRGGQSLVLWEGQICAGGEAGKDSCRGDSGAPLMYQNNRTFEAVGLVSFGADDCGTINVPGVYTYIYQYLAWIRSSIQE